MGGSPEERGERLALAMCVGLLAAACASSVTLEDGRWHAAGGHASVVDLAALDAGWRHTEQAGALLAFEAEGGARACWIRRCPGAVAGPRPEAHALLISLDGAQVREEGDLTLDGAPAWWLRAEANERERAVQVKAVTRVAAGCTDDFLLVGPGDLAPHEPVFDRWWESYQAGSPGKLGRVRTTDRFASAQRAPARLRLAGGERRR